MYICVIYQLVYVPLRVSFGGRASTGMKIFDFIVDMVFICNMIVTFFTVIFDKEKIIVDRKTIANSYLRSFFFFDLLVSFPTQLINEDIGYPIKLMRLTQFFKRRERLRTNIYF